ncbi:MAG: thiamine phosphate synthase, partial [Alphaproteobacteria bacterium]|nr:thiamine phosphate synthase [Alphaproteobacteria bacterium]
PSPYRPTPEILEDWQATMEIPCVAIGGITPANCGPLVEAGADFLAVVSYVWEHPESPAKAVEEFTSAIARSAKKG